MNHVVTENTKNKEAKGAKASTENKTAAAKPEEIIIFSENHSMEDYIVGKQIGQGAYATVHIGVHKK